MNNTSPNTPQSLTLSEKNRLIYQWIRFDPARNNYDSVPDGVTIEEVKTWQSQYQSIITGLNSKNKETVQKAFRDYKLCVGFDDSADLGTLNDMHIVSKISDKDFFIRAIMADKKNHSLIQSVRDLKIALSCISHKKIGFIKNVLGKEKFLSVLHSVKDLKLIINKFPAPQAQPKFLKTIIGREKLRTLIKSFADLRIIWPHIQKKNEFIQEVFGVEEFRSMIASADDFILLFLGKFKNCHSAEYFVTNILGIKKVQSLFNTVDDLKKLTGYGGDFSGLAFVKEIIGSDKTRSIIKSVADLRALLVHFGYLGYTFFIKEILEIEKFHSMINSFADLKSLLENIDDGYYDPFAFIKGVFGEKKFLSLVHSPKDLELIITLLPPFDVDTVYEKENIVKNKAQKNNLRKAFVQKELEEKQLLQYRLDVLKQINFDKHITVFENKGKVLREKSQNNPNYLVATNKAEILCTRLKEAKDSFLNSKDAQREQSKKAFQDICVGHIREAKTVLAQHRGWSGAFAKFLVDLIGWISQCLASKLGLFGKTDSLVKLEELEKDFGIDTNIHSLP